MKITKADVVECLKEGGKLIGSLSLKIYGESLNKVGEHWGIGVQEAEDRLI